MPVDTYDGKVVVPRGDKETVLNNEKEIVHVETLPEPCDEEHSKEAIPLATKPPVSRKSRPVKERLNRRFCGIRAKWVLLGLTSMILLTIILGVGIGVGLRSG